MPKRNLEKLTNLLKEANRDTVSKAEVIEFFKALVQVVREARDEMKASLSDSEAILVKKFDTMLKGVEGVEKDLEQRVDKAEQVSKKLFADALLELRGELARAEVALAKQIPAAQDLGPLYRRIDDVRAMIPTIPLIPDPDTPEQVRDKLEKLSGDDRLDKSAIKGLDEELDDIKKTKALGSGGGVRRVFQPYIDDFSGDTDGSTKTFYLSREPLKTDTILVWGTDFPIILRPTTDFTVSGKALTLTSAVPAPSQGATLLAMYHA